MVLKLSLFSLTLFVLALSITSSATRTWRVVTWQNLEEFSKGGWWPPSSSLPGKPFSKPSDISSDLAKLDSNVTGNGVWSGTEYAKGFIFRKNFTGFEGSAKVIEANLTIMYYYRGEPAPHKSYIFFLPCQYGVMCEIQEYLPIAWYWETFRIGVTDAQNSGFLSLIGLSGSCAAINVMLLNEVSYSYDTDEPEPTIPTTTARTTTTTTTTTEPTTTPTTKEPTTTTTTTEPTTKSPTTESTTATETTEPTTENTSTEASTKAPPSETTTTEPSFQSTIEPWQNVTEIDFKGDIPDNGRWSFDCAIGYADVPSSFSCQAGSVNIPLESLNGEEGFWTKCGLRCLIEYSVQPSDRLYKARIFQKNIMTEVIYDSQRSEFIPGSGWVNLSIPLNGVQSIGIRLDHMDPDVFTLLDKITVEAESE